MTECTRECPAAGGSEWVTHSSAVTRGGVTALGGPLCTRLISVFELSAVRSIGADFSAELTDVLAMADFVLLPQSDLEESFQQQLQMGIDVIRADPAILERKLWYRSCTIKDVNYSSWRTLYLRRKIRMRSYQRLVIVFRLNPDSNHEELKRSTRTWNAYFQNKVRLTPVVVNETPMNPQSLYMRLFKDVEVADIDMLLPGSTVKFSWLDQVFIWGPILFGLGAACYKIAFGTIKFDTLIRGAQSAALIVMPCVWGVNAWLAVKEKHRQYHSHLNELAMLHMVNTNAGVISQLVDEAQEQEDNEALLSFFFLWMGQADPQAMTKLQLDTDVEYHLQAIMDKQGLPVTIDFDVSDGIDKLVMLNLLDVSTVGNTTMLKVANLDKALELVHVKNFDEEREVNGGSKRSCNSPTAGPAQWMEAFSVYKLTGQKFRYFFNTATHETTYVPPDSYIAATDPAGLSLPSGMRQSELPSGGSAVAPRPLTASPGPPLASLMTPQPLRAGTPGPTRPGTAIAQALPDPSSTRPGTAIAQVAAIARG
ncbi:MAG: hypothetical protein WDW38_009657 [Sanguina aurantia]